MNTEREIIVGGYMITGNLESVNKFCADKCGVKTNSDGWFEPAYFDFPVYHKYEWTIEAPRCREILRQEFIIDSISGDGDWSCLSVKMNCSGVGKTEPEAFKACILSIVEQEGK